jgi:glutamyl-tRNA synthetase
MTVVTRFAPSPTGYLHIGGARTALFNWLFARHHGGQFLLRIEDTDRARSTEAATAAIFDGLSWLGLDHDGEAVSQFSRRERHAEVARSLLDKGQAYYCYATQDELAEAREAQRAAGLPLRYDGRWRDRDPAEAPAGILPTIRLRAPQTGETVVDDQVQGPVTVANEQLDDMVLLRGDGTPTYMLSVVVDDHDYGITHIIRGDDHLTNAFRQTQLYRAMGWETPIFAHIPLIHGPDGKKLSKRHGALGVDAWRDMGYLPETMRNYLLRLGWGHGDAEIISRDEAIKLFDIDAVGRAASRMDYAKLTHVNGVWLRQADDARLTGDVMRRLAGRPGLVLDRVVEARVLTLMPGLKERAKTLLELAESAAFLARPLPFAMDAKAAALLTDDAKATLRGVAEALAATDFSVAAVDASLRAFAEAHGKKLGQVAQPLRAALTGSTMSPGIDATLAALGRGEALARIAAAAA